MDINRVSLTGRLTKDVEVRSTQSNKLVAVFTIAANRTKEKADFINCIAWEKLAEIIAKYTSKGNKIGVEGRIETRNYQNEQGKKVYITEVRVDNVVFLEPKKEVHQQQTITSDGNDAMGFGDFDNVPEVDIKTDDLPFY